jgi:ankyrin repeat protein
LQPHAELMGAILAKKPHGNVLSFTTKTGHFPLRAACLAGDAECVCQLIDAGADVNQESARGTALVAAAMQVRGVL